MIILSICCCFNLSDTTYTTRPSIYKQIVSQLLFGWGGSLISLCLFYWAFCLFLVLCVLCGFVLFFLSKTKHNPGTHNHSLTCSWPRIKTPPGLIGCQGARFSPVPSFSPSWKASHIPSLVVHVIQIWCHFPSLMKRGSWATYKENNNKTEK